jgi:hypothetical protein
MLVLGERLVGSLGERLGERLRERMGWRFGERIRDNNGCKNYGNMFNERFGE